MNRRLASLTLSFTLALPEMAFVASKEEKQAECANQLKMHEMHYSKRNRRRAKACNLLRDMRPSATLV